jgi:hypothetical protein
MSSPTLNFKDLAQQLPVPDGVSGDWAVETFQISKEESGWTAIRAFFHPEAFVSPGSYKKLTRRGTIVMSNTDMEIRTNLPIWSNGKGHVLVNGLGLGMVLHALLHKPEVTRVTVVENSPDVIRLVGPTFSGSRVEIIQADALEYRPARGIRFGAVWHDIWDSMCADNLPAMEKLHRRYGRICDWQGSWARELCARR